ncbi:acyltransferase 3 [Globomyces pollinis-pini]|nr:acyltransferase 3 [Globomyces pollinis-pini]
MSKLIYLEGIRGLAALWVFFNHYGKHLFPVFYNTYLIFDRDVALSVAVFFVLSGRVLTMSATKKKNFKSIVGSLIRRPFRLTLPLIGITFIDYWFRSYYKPRITPHVPIWKLIMIPANFVVNRSDVFNTPGVPITGNAWTLSIEFYGSLVCYMIGLILVLFNNNSKPRWIVLLASLSYNFFFGSWNDHFIAGMVLAELSNAGILQKLAKIKLFLLFNIVSGLLIFYAFSVTPYSDYALPIRNYFTSFQMKQNGQLGRQHEMIFYRESPTDLMAAFLMLFMFETTPILQRFLSLPPFIFLGRVSFMMYLMNDIFIHYLSHYAEYYIGKQTNSEIFLVTVVNLCFLFVISEILTIVIDTPSVDFSRWIEKVVLSDWTLKDLIGGIAQICYYNFCSV